MRCKKNKNVLITKYTRDKAKKFHKIQTDKVKSGFYDLRTWRHQYVPNSDMLETLYKDVNADNLDHEV